MRRRRGVAGAVLIGLMAVATPALAQRILVLPEPRGTAVALAIDLNAGGIWDPAEQAGVSRLAAESILEGLRRELRVLGASGRLD